MIPIFLIFFIVRAILGCPETNAVDKQLHVHMYSYYRRPLNAQSGRYIGHHRTTFAGPEGSSAPQATGARPRHVTLQRSSRAQRDVFGSAIRVTHN